MSWRRLKTAEGNEFVIAEKRKERLARIRKEKADAVVAARTEVLRAFREHVEALKIEVVIGVDEVGTGALAGPVVMGACVMAPWTELDVKDSKAYGYYPKRRMEAYHRIKASGDVIDVCTETVEIEELIEKGQAKAMEKGYSRLVDRVCSNLHDQGISYDKMLVAMDGKLPIIVPEHISQVTLVRGDEFITQISAASVYAKVYRDGLMYAADKKYPGYKFCKHKGYGTSDHTRAIKELGPCAIHRTYIARIQQAIAKREQDVKD